MLTIGYWQCIHFRWSIHRAKRQASAPFFNKFLTQNLNNMNQAQFHLLLNHLPVMGTLIGLLVLAVSLFIRNQAVSKVAGYILVISAISIAPVYLSGEGAEEAVEAYGVNEALIEEHEDAAKVSMVFIIATGLLALLALLMVDRRPDSSGMFWRITLLSALITFGALAWTAHQGGKIRHPEISNGTASTTSTETGGEVEEDDD